MRNNIPVTECFGVFSKVIAFACNGSWSAAARTRLSECRRARPDAIQGRAPGGDSPAGLVRPMSRGQITERRELSLPQGPDWHSADWHSDSQHLQRTVRFDDGLQGESCRLAAPVSCEAEERPRCRTLKVIHNPVALPAGQPADPRGAELATTANGLFASLVFHQVRPRNRSAADAAKRSGSSDDPKPDLVSDAVTIDQAGSPGRVPGPVETLFTELAARCLGSLAARERP
jgi:hypothetical protein